MDYQNLSVKEAKKVIQQCFEKFAKDLMGDDSLPWNAKHALWLTLCGWDIIDPVAIVFCAESEDYLKEIESNPEKGIDELLSIKYAHEMLEDLARIDPDYEAFPRSEAALSYTAFVGFFGVGLLKFCEKKEVSK